MSFTRLVSQILPFILEYCRTNSSITRLKCCYRRLILPKVYHTLMFRLSVLPQVVLKNNSNCNEVQQTKIHITLATVL